MVTLCILLAPVALANLLTLYVAWRRYMSTPNPVPVPNPTTWTDGLADLKAEEWAALFGPLVAFEGAIAGKDPAQIVEAGAAVPQAVVANEISLAPTVLGQLLSIIIAKGSAALAPKPATPAPTTSPTPAAPATPAS